MKIKLMNKFKNIILFRYCFGLIALLLFGIPVVILANSFQKSLSQYSHQVWQSHNGLSQTGITSIVQGKDGYIWIATRVGLVRFDGMRFVTYNHRNTPALTNDNIWVFL